MEIAEVVANNNEKIVTREECLNAGRQAYLALIHNEQDYFEMLNLEHSTDLRYLKYAVMNKLSIIINDIRTLTDEDLREISIILEAYMTLADREKLEEYLKSLASKREKYAMVLSRFHKLRSSFLQKKQMRKSKIDTGSWISSEYVLETVKNYSNVSSYNVNYSCDLSEADNSSFLEILNFLKKVLENKYQEYSEKCRKNDEGNKLQKKYDVVIKKYNAAMSLDPGIKLSL